MMCLDVISPEERFKYGGWLYYISEGWKDPNWWEKNMDLAEATGHVLHVIVTKFTAP